MKNKIAIIGTVGVPANYGGFETLAHFLVEHTSSNDFDKESELMVYCSKHSYPKSERKPNIKKAKLIYLPFKANGVQSIPYDIVSIIHSCFVAQSLLILGVSGCLVLPFIRLFVKKKIVVNIDGLEWKRDKWNKYAKRFLKFSEAQAVKYADVVVTDNAAIQQYVQEEYGVASELIEYGGDHVINVDLDENYFLDFPFLQEEYAFKVCRIEPENNVHLIVESFAKNPICPLVIVGNWNHSQYGKQLKTKFENSPSIYLLDPIYDSFLLNLLRANARIYVHGHSAGGTNPSLVEAMYLGLPIISFDVAYNRETTENQALYFSDAESLNHLLLKIDTNGLNKISQKMKAIAERRYRWDIVSTKYFNQLGNTPVPINPQENVELNQSNIPFDALT